MSNKIAGMSSGLLARLSSTVAEAAYGFGLPTMGACAPAAATTNGFRQLGHIPSAVGITRVPQLWQVSTDIRGFLQRYFAASSFAAACTARTILS